MAFKIGDGGESLRPFQEWLNRKWSKDPIKVDLKYGLDEARKVATAMKAYGMDIEPSVMHIVLNGTMTRVEGAIATDEFLSRASWRPPQILPWLFTVHGAGQPDPLGPGLPADTARACLDKYRWQPIGNYPASAFPMWDSIMQGYAELVLQIEQKLAGNDDDFALAGYSEGAVVVGQVLKHEIQDPAGRLHKYLPRLRKVVFWGNPMRQKGIRHFDEWVWPIAPADTSGILEDRLEGLEKATFEVRDYAHAADMYASCGFDTKSQNKRAICKIIMKPSDIFSGDDSLTHQLIELAQSPIPGAIGIALALIDTIKFFASNAHGYNIYPAIAFLRS